MLRNLMTSVGLCLVLTLLGATSSAHSTTQSKAKKEVLTNASVIEMVKLGLSETVVIAKIRQSEHQFDTSVEGLKRLKAAQVGNAIIAAMLDAPIKSGSGGGAVKPGSVASKSNAPSKRYPQELGVYVNQDGKWGGLPVEKADWKTGGILKSLGRGAIIGSSGADVDVYLTGPTSTLTAPRKAEFLLRLAEEDAPVSYQLVKLTQKKDRREFKNGRSGFIGMKNGAGKAAVPFEANKVGTRTYLIKLELEPGEYCFFKAATGMNSDSGMAYSFKID